VIKLDFKTLAQNIDGRLVDARFGTTSFEGVSIDSRTIKASQLFIAIRGEKNDGHKYIDIAIKKKSAGLIVSYDFPDAEKIGGKIPTVMVKDTHRSMMSLAAYYRRSLKAKCIAITGSNGKTTTKEFTHAMMQSKYPDSFRSPGNLNNLYGLPLALFAVPTQCTYAVFELGISVPGEMTKLAEMVRPDLVLITNVGPTHLETLGTVEKVAEAKFELVDSIGDDIPVVLNADDPILQQAAVRCQRRFVTFGINNPADFTAEEAGVSPEGFPIVRLDNQKIKINLFGKHQIYNLLGAYAACRTLGINIRPSDLEKIEYSPISYRGEIESINGVTVIADCYNANPVSMKSGLLSFSEYLKSPGIAERRGLVVIGDMLELGAMSSQYHRQLGELLSVLSFDMIYTVGPMSTDMYHAALDHGVSPGRIKHFENTQAAGEALLTDVARGDIVFFKASRSLGLEKIITLLRGAAFRQN
jgi:UDP-N-acetylmuramoyl-tripeptide--D-alanyl-D-alanine ligase